MVKSTNLWISIATLLMVAAGCAKDDNMGPEGLYPTYDSGGATAIFDLNARPLPKIPLPNDVATRLDPTSPTGRRINVSTMAPTELEQEIRVEINKLEGFSILPNITVEFDKPLDPRSIVERHTEDVPNFEDDAIYLVNIDRDSEGYGELVLLDLGRGNYPVTMKRPDKYFDFDPRLEGSNLVYESVLEKDENGNGVLDPLEDTDDDGIWDHPNTLTQDADPLEPGEMMTFYERETNTLIGRPVVPLREATKYAVVITDKLLDEEGFPINSPFKYINHTRQTEELEVLRQILPKRIPSRFDESLKNVRLAWSFSTQSTTQSMLDIRAGLYGEGSLGWLKDDFPADLNFVGRGASDDSDENPLIIKLGAVFGIIIDALAGGLDPGDRAALLSAMEGVDYIIAGSYTTPFFLVDKDGLAGSEEEVALNINTFDEEEVFDIDFNTGEAQVGKDEVTFLCAIPKAMEGREPPFPVVIYGHGYGSSRIEGLGFAGQMAKFGLASCAIDNVGHGLTIPEEFRTLAIVDQVLKNLKLENLLELLEHGRHRDLNNDGLPDSGADYWVSDLFHLRDNVRQTNIDYMQFIRMIRSWDGTKRWPDKADEDNIFVKVRPNIVAGFDADGDGKGEIAGDFNGDGVVDIGGEQAVYAWGQSLGGIQSASLVGMEPLVKAAAPTAGAAGLLDTGIRSSQGGVPQAVILPFLGPIVLGRPIFDWNAQEGVMEDIGRYQLEFLVNTGFDAHYVPFAVVEGLETGDQVTVRNLNREKYADIIDEHEVTSRVTVRPTGFRTGMASDSWKASEKRKALGFDPFLDVTQLEQRLGDVESGLRATIYHSRSARVVRDTETAATIDQAWAEGEAPLAGMHPSNHTIIYRGLISGPGDVTLQAETTGRMQVSIEGERIIDVRNGLGEADFSFEPGTDYPIEIRYDREAMTGMVKLSWVQDDIVELVPSSAFKTHAPMSAEEQAEYEKHIAEDPTEWGDPYVIEIRDAAGNLKESIDTFQMDAFFQNIKYPTGVPLAALSSGLGQRRQSPGIRRMLAIAQMIVDPAEAVSFARHYYQDPLEFPYETEQFQNGGSNVLVVPTIGDSSVPINTGIAIARFAGIVDPYNNDERYGKTANQFLIQNYVYEGISWLDRFQGYPNALFDPDDLDEGGYRLKGDDDNPDPNPDAMRPLRATVQTEFGMSGMRIPYMSTEGEHGFFLPQPSKAFDIDSYMANQIGYYFATGGKELIDDVCLADLTMAQCSFFDMETWQRPNPYQ